MCLPEGEKTNDDGASHQCSQIYDAHEDVQLNNNPLMCQSEKENNWSSY